jgi:hypothetical protein
MKCKKCGYENLSGGTKCGKCGTPFAVDRISCPKCATINDGKVLRCKKCGYKFNTKSKTLLHIIISVLLMVVLVVFVILDKTKWVENVDKGFKILAIVLVILLVLETLLFRRDDAIDRNIPELKAGKKKFEGMKAMSYLSLIILGLFLLGIGLYFAIKYLF